MQQKNIILLLLVLLYSTISFAQFEDVKKGDIIDINGLKAIVYTVDEFGHGSAMSIMAFRGQKSPWCIDKKALKELNMSNLSDGSANTQAVYNYCNSHNVSLSSFPAFNWCKRLGEGWYIPAENQLKDFINFWLGNDQDFNWDDDDEETGLDLNASSPKKINEKIMDAGGTPFFVGVYTSTMDSDENVTVYWYNENKGTWRFKKVKASSLKIKMSGRAFYDF